jgi:hypothetical protein
MKMLYWWPRAEKRAATFGTSHGLPNVVGIVDGTPEF